MAKNRYFFEKIKDIKPHDFVDLIIMLIALLICPFYKKAYSSAWLITDEPYEARDNGYHLFKYICQHHSEQKCFFAIKKSSKDYQKIKNIGSVIEFGSIQHWVAYFNCKYIISSQKSDGKPNGNLCVFLELVGIVHVKNVFLQHGITINNARWLYADRAKIDCFITSATPETSYIKQYFGYPKDTICETGLSRFDVLHDFVNKKNRILIMPTWRGWLILKSKRSDDIQSDFIKSEYLEKWTELLNSRRLEEYAKHYGLEIFFYPHRNMQQYLDRFSIINPLIKIASWKEYDVQELLMTSEMMITDYSSVFFDMVYMKKPVIFFQFDEKDFREHHYAKGWFDYHTTSFGKCCGTTNEVLDELERLIKDQYKVSQAYLQEHKNVFTFYDKNNSRRLYNCLINIDNQILQGK